MATKALVISADDYAQNAAIDAGILHLIALGKLSATSCLTLSPRWPQAAQQLAQYRSLADVGLHLDFTQYAQPLHMPLAQLIGNSLLRRLPASAVRNSILHQLQRFEDATGHAPDYIDGHQHVHQLPQIRTALVDILQQRYPQEHLPWLRLARPDWKDGVKAGVIRLLGAAALEQAAQQAGIACSQRLLGVYGFGQAGSYLPRLQRALDQASDQKETKGLVVLMCHPATSEQDDRNDSIQADRRQEYNDLLHYDLEAALASRQLRLLRGTRYFRV
ncbi:ChbG/HpnK family deacetylase [Methylobacillus flagellatus]|uniref:ChbG/HpnK family deacetylase n=1 Tax=Methylobacillus flagellatus TaxID=405 RepID=UPI0010F84AA6|nr:ChbG/HpnK family deacetylase [Methylobacillus flagellatus]